MSIAGQRHPVHGASELMAIVQTAMLGRLPFTPLRDALFTHPTGAEGLTVLLADVAPRWDRQSGTDSPTSLTRARPVPHSLCSDHRMWGDDEGRRVPAMRH